MSQLSLPIQEFYQALSDGDRQYAQSQAQEIRLEQHNTAVRIGNRLISVKERLGHGNFGKWIKLEFQWSDRQAQMLMKIASELGNAKDTSDLPTATMPLYALASAMSKEDEEGKQEIFQAYHEKAQEKGSPLSEKEVKELKAKVKQLEADNATLDRRIKEKGDLLTAANSKLTSEAERIAEEKAQKLKEEFEAKLQSLESDKAKAEEASKKAKSDYESALAKFKANPDTETQKAILDLKDQFERTKGEVDRVQHSLENLKKKEDQTFSVALSLERFHGAFQKLISNHPDAIVAMSSPYLDDRQLAGIELLAETLEDWAERIRHSVNLSRESNATAIRAVEVEVLEDGDDF